MEESTMVEEREEVMASLARRQAFFLKPSSVNETVTGSGTLSPSLSFPYSTFDPQNWPLKVSFGGWRYPGLYWAKWVSLLLPQYRSVWEKVGIFDAILSTTHRIKRDGDLVCGVVERWCPETKSFVFVWGEATITLEDVMVLGGFSVTGEHVSLPLVTSEMKEIEERLAVARTELHKGKSGKAKQQCWLKKFMGSGSDIEHEAFLVFWLSKYVFPYTTTDLIRSSIFPIAIHLARGVRIALAPAVLAVIYRDLTLLKRRIADSIMLDGGEDGDDVSWLTLWAPFQLVQLWAWERFPQVQPVPNSLKEGDTRSARWHAVKRVRVGDVRSVLDSAGESFLWRPYTNAVHNWRFDKFYKEREGWIHVESGLDEMLLSFARCIRVSQLVGLEDVEQYLPHRVAMQFGMDQDLPASIHQPDKTRRTAWRNYRKPIGNKLYIPPRVFESDVTFRYLEWWKKSVLCKLDVLRRPRSSRRWKQTMRSCNGVDSLGNSNNKTVEGSRTEPVSDTPRSCNGHSSNKAAKDCDLVFGKSHPLNAEPVNESGDDGMVEQNMSSPFKAPIMQGADDTKAISLTKTTVSLNAGEDSTCKHETIALDFEARVTKLEEFFAKLKAAKLRRGFE